MGYTKATLRAIPSTFPCLPRDCRHCTRTPSWCCSCIDRDAGMLAIILMAIAVVTVLVKSMIASTVLTSSGHDYWRNRAGDGSVGQLGHGNTGARAQLCHADQQHHPPASSLRPTCPCPRAVPIIPLHRVWVWRSCPTLCCL